MLVLWGSSAPVDRLQALVEDVKKIVGGDGLSAVENIERLSIGMFLMHG